MLVQYKHLIVWPGAKTQVGPVCRITPLFGIFLLHQRVKTGVLRYGVYHLGVVARVIRCNLTLADEAEAAFPVASAEVTTPRHQTYLLHHILADICQEQIAIVRIPAKTLRVAHAIGVDFRPHIVFIHKRVVGRNTIAPVVTVIAERVDTFNSVMKGKAAFPGLRPDVSMSAP